MKEKFVLLLIAIFLFFNLSGLVKASPGDVASPPDGKIDPTDAQAALQMYLGKLPQDMDADVYPLNSPDGKIKPTDALIILKHYLGKLKIIKSSKTDDIKVDNNSANEAFIEDASAFKLTKMIITGTNSPTVTATLTLSTAAAGSFSTATSGAVTSTFNGTVWRASGAMTDVNTLLEGVTFTPAKNWTQNFTITSAVNDGIATTVTGIKNVTVTAVNDPPTLSAIANQTTAVNAATSAIPFTVSDLETAAASLTVAGSSSNKTVVPDANIVFGGSGGSRTVTVTPASGQSGTATITVTVSDDSATTSTTFTVTVNQAPTISSIAGQITNTNTPTTAIAFTIADAETSAVSLTVTGNSSNKTLLPDANIVFGGLDASRAITITPAPGQSGTAKITITVSDSTATASTTFTLTVNQSPTISFIANQITQVNTATSAITFTIADAETAAASLTVTGSSSNKTLVPDAKIAFGGSGASRTITITPASKQSGTATITVTVSDGLATTSTTFTVTVNQTPTISSMATQIINTNTATSVIAFTIGDTETAAASLTVTGSSSNKTLVPDDNIVFGGSGSSRTVIVTPESGQFGTATIMVTVSDGSGTTSTTFNVIVSAPGFTDNNNGTVTHTGTGLILLKDPGCLGGMAWEAAVNTAANYVRSGTCGLTDGSTSGQWRLPKKNSSSPNDVTPQGELSVLVQAHNSKNAFTRVHDGNYWTSTPTTNTSQAYSLRLSSDPMDPDVVYNYSKTTLFSSWPVRGGQ